jgi:hypothetical protein
MDKRWKGRYSTTGIENRGEKIARGEYLCFEGPKYNRITKEKEYMHKQY